jgi:hypothetical protein
VAKGALANPPSISASAPNHSLQARRP